MLKCPPLKDVYGDVFKWKEQHNVLKRNLYTEQHENLYLILPNACSVPPPALSLSTTQL